MIVLGYCSGQFFILKSGRQILHFEIHNSNVYLKVCASVKFYFDFSKLFNIKLHKCVGPNLQDTEAANPRTGGAGNVATIP